MSPLGKVVNWPSDSARCFAEYLKKPPEVLVMNQGDAFRKTQEERHMVDRTIPFVDSGKGCENSCCWTGFSQCSKWFP